jgi:hypothetical protein
LGWFISSSCIPGDYSVLQLARTGTGWGNKKTRSKGILANFFPRSSVILMLYYKTGYIFRMWLMVTDHSLKNIAKSRII